MIPKYNPQYYSKHSLILVPGEQNSFILNTLLTDSGTATLWIMNVTASGGYSQAQQITLQSKTYSAGKMYYSIFTPEALPVGAYVLGLHFGGTLKYVSSPYWLPGDDFSKYSVLLKYRHNKNAFGFMYDDLPNFYQLQRVSIMEFDRQPEYNIDTYISSTSGKRRNYNDQSQEIVKFETLFFEDEQLAAMAVILQHSDIYINNEKFTFKTGLKRPQSGTNGKGEFELYSESYINAKTTIYG